VIRLPPLEGRPTSRAIADTGNTRLGRAIGPLVEAHPGLSGIYPLPDSRDSFAARAGLVRAAERTLDIQYYIWRRDMLGIVLLGALKEAADRGVRVRLLLDDQNTFGLDPMLAALDAHENIEVRLFNPFVPRRPRIGYLTDFWRANRRMHNKSFTADNQATIIGGRNVGNEYFDAAEGPLFADLDVLAVGPVVQEVSRDFDRYWACDSAYPVARLIPPADQDALQALDRELLRVRQDATALAYLERVRQLPFAIELAAGRLDFEWARTRMVSDDPGKGLGRAARGASVPDQLRTILGDAVSTIDLISPYFVPTRTSARFFRELARAGVRVRILVNSLEATDVPIVHSGYSKHRRALLDAGVTFYELKRYAPYVLQGARRAGLLGSSTTSLHAKTFAVDAARVFIGSFNFDPRSVNLNTELGFVIESPALARQIHQTFDDTVPLNAYEVVLNHGELRWVEHRANGPELVHETEPGTSAWQRALVWALGLLPIDSFL
jgi:putative cardiolipin synthase